MCARPTVPTYSRLRPLGNPSHKAAFGVCVGGGHVPDTRDTKPERCSKRHRFNDVIQVTVVQVMDSGCETYAAQCLEGRHHRSHPEVPEGSGPSPESPSHGISRGSLDWQHIREILPHS